MDTPDFSKATVSQLLAEIKSRGVDVDLSCAADDELIDELDDRGYEIANFIDGDIEASCEVRDDLTFCRDALLRRKPADALAMLERLLFPQGEVSMAAKYRKAADNRDPASGRPVIA